MILSLTGEIPVVVIDPQAYTGALTGHSAASAWAIPETPVGRFADIMAPLGETVWYTSESGVELGRITVTSTVQDVLSDLAGRDSGVIIRDPEIKRTGDNAPDVLWARDSTTPFITFPNVTRAPIENTEFATTDGATATVSKLLDDHAILALRHNTAKCGVTGCRLPAVRIIAIDTWTDTLMGDDDLGEIVSWTLAAFPATVGVPAPVWTWGDITAAHDTWGGVAGLDSWGMVRDEG